MIVIKVIVLFTELNLLSTSRLLDCVARMSCLINEEMRKEIKELSTNEEMRKLFKSFGWVRLSSVNNVCRSQVSSIVPGRMSSLIEELRNKPEMMKMFKKHKWVRVCTECGDFVGNTANWIEHCVKSHIKTHLKTVKNWYNTEPPVPKEPPRMNTIVEELSSELVDEKGDDEVDEDKELASEIVMTLVLQVVDAGEGDGDEEYEEFLKEQQEKEATGPERDQVEEKRPGKRKREKEERDQELCNVCAVKEEHNYC